MRIHRSKYYIERPVGRPSHRRSFRVDPSAVIGLIRGCTACDRQSDVFLRFKLGGVNGPPAKKFEFSRCVDTYSAPSLYFAAVGRSPSIPGLYQHGESAEVDSSINHWRAGGASFTLCVKGAVFSTHLRLTTINQTNAAQIGISSPLRVPALPCFYVPRQSPTLFKLLEVRNHGSLTQ